MSNKKIVIASVALVILVAGWYAFRPELLFVNKRVNETFPAAEATTGSSALESAVVASGQFHGVAHETSGLATIHRLPDGRQVLRFTNFATSNGPDVNVYLVAAADARDNATVPSAGFISLGPIKGNVGDQNYDLPEGIDLNKYRAVTIWCRRFAVNFGTAPLAPPPS